MDNGGCSFLYRDEDFGGIGAVNCWVPPLLRPFSFEVNGGPAMRAPPPRLFPSAGERQLSCDSRGQLAHSGLARLSVCVVGRGCDGDAEYKQ